MLRSDCTPPQLLHCGNRFFPGLGSFIAISVPFLPWPRARAKPDSWLRRFFSRQCWRSFASWNAQSTTSQWPHIARLTGLLSYRFLSSHWPALWFYQAGSFSSCVIPESDSHRMVRFRSHSFHPHQHPAREPNKSDINPN